MKTRDKKQGSKRAAARTCVVCQEPVRSLSPCPSCPNPYHERCAPQVEACGALGCPAGASQGRAPQSQTERTSGVQCPYCREGFEPRESTITCQGCRTRYHAECGDDLRRCGTLGCGRKLPRPPEPA
ncbi:MAG: hypothetical protein KDD82_15360, partial [Planctomycetes bacterium]|nr:hypothetical protein [Planctomycetota bacterium]